MPSPCHHARTRSSSTRHCSSTSSWYVWTSRTVRAASSPPCWTNSSEGAGRVRLVGLWPCDRRSKLLISIFLLTVFSPVRSFPPCASPYLGLQRAIQRAQRVPLAPAMRCFVRQRCVVLLTLPMFAVRGFHHRQCLPHTVEQSRPSYGFTGVHRIPGLRAWWYEVPKSASTTLGRLLRVQKGTIHYGPGPQPGDVGFTVVRHPRPRPVAIAIPSRARARAPSGS